MLAAGIILLTAAITVARIDNSVDHVRLTLGEVKSLVSCEVMKNGEVIFRCDGEENNCREKYKSLFTDEITIKCSGTYKEVN